MASAVEIDLEALTRPIDDGAPSGPDLEADEDDEAYVNFISGTEVFLPTEYMIARRDTGERVPFQNHSDFEDLNLPALIDAGLGFCALTHDLRLLALLAKLCILNRSTKNFDTIVQGFAALLETEWDSVHPQDGDGAELRAAAVERLDEPLIVTALNNAALFTSKRFGPITMQAYTAAARKAAGGGSDTSSVDRVLADECSGSPEVLRAIRSTIDRLGQGLNRIRTAFMARNVRGTPQLAGITDAVSQLQALFERVDPTGAAPADTGPAGDDAASVDGDRPQDATSRVARPAIGTARQAAAALDAATKHLVETEPSSPALLLLRQAQSLVGKSFFESMKALFPETVKHAGFSVATPTVFRLPLTMLAETAAAARDADDGTASLDEGVVAAPTSRAEAIALLDGAAAYYRTAEPSSPIPMLLDRARPLLGQDFMALVRSMLPERVLAEK